MKDFVKYYTITLVMEGRFSIASGQSIGKKEYLLMRVKNRFQSLICPNCIVF